MYNDQIWYGNTGGEKYVPRDQPRPMLRQAGPSVPKIL